MDTTTNIEAVIFDLDGVLVRTNHLHQMALESALITVMNIDIKLIPELYVISMMSTKEKICHLQSLYRFSDAMAEIVLEVKDSIYQYWITNLIVDSNVYATLDYLKKKQIKLAIASNSRKSNIIHILSTTGIDGFFDAIVSAEEVQNRKPSPDIIFETYSRLGISGYNTLFIEDTSEGALAGYNSLSTVIIINNPGELNIKLFSPWIN